MLSRRQFLVGGSCATGAWLVGARLAGIITRLAGVGRPYLINVERPQVQLWANRSCGEYVLTVGCPEREEQQPELSWRQWLEIKGVDVSKPKEIREFLYDWGECTTETGEIYIPTDLEAQVLPSVQGNYLDWEYAMYDSPAARAYHYLMELDLADRLADGEGLGLLEFVEGPRPGENSRYVTTTSVALLGGLQQRLLQLGERVRISTDLV